MIIAKNLNEEAAKCYIKASLKREYASQNGTELNEVLPKISPLNPENLTKKQNVFQKMSAFVEKFKGAEGSRCCATKITKLNCTGLTAGISFG